ncbi:GGDEF domain-containing phosphodiesterase [Pseudomonas sp.]|uniref:GGDEF domain-containing phosphodiesterase n=1 Tax=Pseudomonas sp. TaxID=306 RepID=UPI0025D0C293|nr:GGDEF domain-containing phosphodiesterase [Pseudomonas sp.]
MNLLPAAVLLTDATERVTFVNREACALLGCSATPLMPWKQLMTLCGVSGGQARSGEQAITNIENLRLSDGRVLRSRARDLQNGGLVVTLEDISLLMRETERARADLVTGLANRFAFHAELSSLVEESRPLAIFMLDLDRFKNINDTLGHGMGDVLLRKVGERLGSVSQAGDIVARLGGDEFALLRPGIVPLEVAETLARRIVDLVGRTYALDGQMLNVGASVGVALSSDRRESADVLMKNADLALYSSKADGRGRYSFFQPEMDARMQARREIELELRRALALKQFELVYQPQIDLESQCVVGFEALLRWRNSKGETISPAAFIPIAEETGLIVPIGEWALRTACQTAAGWDTKASVAVNLSPVQFRSSQLVQTVVSALANSGLSPDRLELEITEGALIDDTEAVVKTLQSLRKLGVKVSMDDFGTGYSSLSYLQKFPFDKIKIDQSFVREMQHNEEAAAIVHAVAKLGASLGMKTTAEGVETEDQLAAIRAEGCDQVQGYLTGRPMSAEDACELTRANRRWTGKGVAL